MATSAYQTAENVKFDGTTTNAVVLKDAAGVKSLIVTDNHTAVDIAMLDALIAAYGGVTPLAGPTAGKQTANFSGTVVGANATGLQNVSAATAGTATINVGGDKVGGGSSGLSTSAGTAGSQVVAFSSAIAGGDASGLANDTTAYTATIVVDGVTKNISILGSAAQTMATVISEINTDLAGAATAAISGGNIKVTSATTGVASKVAITDGTLFSTLTKFVGIMNANNGGGVARTYSATVVVDGVAKSVNFTGVQGNTFTNVISQINTDLGGAATAALTGGNIVITSATTGASSSVVVYDTGLFGALTGFAGISSVAGTAPRNYTATITVDGVAKAISIQGSAAQTFTTLIAEINTDLGVSATAAISGGNIVVTSATTGTSSSVSIVDGDLFKALTGFKGFNTAQPGAADLVAVLQSTRAPSGAKYSEIFQIKLVGAKPAVQPNTPHTTKFIYFDGTVWKYLDDDATV